ncbi:PHA accumulation regulator DNA-binding-like protein [Planktothrix sp. PCC 11201]|uniref:type IV pilin-like G/H family protein n=1 Tax=Planktothrix sp. PCC 11201 TaxID=1729650 RepID=UPI000919CD07|nr:type IV pilin-like G/H family protein [Planktothrix sp. PCC 11201]SKB12030.1 PHA accumulation regulator DNA-binding-like protein [Planktothrix sp. PCC 11201]
MKTEFKAKFLQYVSNRKKEEGFTLIELLVVIIIIGILAAIALPSFLSQANKAKQSEAKQYLASINKGQQAYYVENTKFGATISELGIGIKTETNNYTYGAGLVALVGATATAAPATGLKPYASGVGLVGAAATDKTTQTLLCEGAVATAPVVPTIDGTAEPTCGAGMSAVTK